VSHCAKPVITFIVPAHNEEAWIGRCVAAIRLTGNTIRVHYEVIVVDDASTDATSQIARDCGARVINVDNRQIAATRNAGARAASGNYFFFVDADTLTNPGAVRAALAAMRNGAVGGGGIVRFDGWVPLWALALYPAYSVVSRIIKLVGGCFLFCTRDAFERVGGFPEAYYASEETYLTAALKNYGRFVVPGPTVVTSARKLRTVPLRDLIRLLRRLLTEGNTVFRQREGLEFWYGPRANDPLQSKCSSLG
jgi:glycosyltransferase involved in cell wall biosynthesis